MESTLMREYTEDHTNHLTFLSKKNNATGVGQALNIRANETDVNMDQTESKSSPQRATYQSTDEFTRK